MLGDTTNVIVLRPGSGLCNRLRAIAAAINLARECNVKLVIDWFRCPVFHWAALCGMRVKFCDLFKPIDGVLVREKIRFRGDFPWTKSVYSEKNMEYYSEATRQEFVDKVKADPKTMKWLWTCHEFYPAIDYKWLSPLPHITKRIDSFVANFGERCIGLHIRRTDNKHAIEFSPISLFTAQMDKMLDEDSEVKFFLSTDDMALKAELRQRYGERLLTCENVSERYTLRGEEDAVVDLFLLSRTAKIYGSFWSSFSEVAAKIGSIPLEVLTVTNAKLPSWATS